MKIIVDHQIVKSLPQNIHEMLKNPLILNSDNQIFFGWPALLEYLGLGSLLKNLPAFDHTQPLFKACLTILYTNEKKEVLCNLYDSLFAENLNQIRALPQISASFILQTIKAERQKTSFLEGERVYSFPLALYERAFIENAPHKMHDLILYLAWDRMCVCMARLFDYQSTDQKFISGIEVLKECLIESYLHIVKQGRTSPGIYRMIESLFFYQTREENLQKHTDNDWNILSQSISIIKSQDVLADFHYIDDAVVSLKKLKTEEENSEYYLTLDSPNQVNSRLLLVEYMMNKLKSEVPQWDYVLQPKKIIYLTS